MSRSGMLEPRYVLTERYNPIIGKTEWETQNEDYDFHQEIARSAYADMLHDVERNQKYYSGLKWAIEKLRKAGQTVRVLDIGTGTGLLSMMAAQLGADEITACEAFEPMSKCAKAVIEQNGYGRRIHLISKRSTEVTVGPDGDMKRRANILITEVFDTELIGEGAVSTFNHAHEHLLEKNCLVIPSRATVYAQIVESDFLWHWNQPRSLSVETSVGILTPDEILSCRGSPAVFDIQLSRLPLDTFKVISDPIPVAKFDFTGASHIASHHSARFKVHAKESGRCDAIFFWWDLEMDELGDLQLSCAPWWHHSSGKDLPWRDHWMQAVYFPSKQLLLQSGQTAFVNCSHDEYSFWFDVLPESQSDSKIDHPVCTCGYHVLCNRNRIGMISETSINEKYVAVLKKLIRPNSICASIGNVGSLLPLISAKLGAKRVYIVDAESISKQIMMAYNKKNGMTDKVKVLDKTSEELTEDDFENEKIDLFVSEPYFLASILPWDNLHVWYTLIALSKHRAKQFKILPATGQLWAVGMHFSHLWKIKAPLFEVEGFKMEHFDRLIQNSSDIADHPVEPQPLWEYEGVALTNPIQLLTFDLASPLSEDVLQISGSIPFASSDIICNGVALWMDWHLDSATCVSRGPIEPIVAGKEVKWDPTSKQGVYFFANLPDKGSNQLQYHASFSCKTGLLDVKFHIH